MVVTSDNNSVNFMLDIVGRAKTSTAVGFEPQHEHRSSSKSNETRKASSLENSFAARNKRRRL
jgi:hypothetical protein